MTTQELESYLTAIGRLHEQRLKALGGPSSGSPDSTTSTTQRRIVSTRRKKRK